jgi:F-type H+-transporting ATPase subunit epsilon
MAKPFQVDVVSPEATVWSGQATFVLARTPDGELGIMADHEPLMGALATGPVEIESETGERTTIGVHGGFLQVLNNQVTLITDRAQLATDTTEAREVAVELAKAEQVAEVNGPA